MKKLLSFIALVALGMSVSVYAQKYPDVIRRLDASGDFAPLFPFQPTHNAPDNITNVRTWDGVSSDIAGSDGFISPEGDHFVDGNGNEIRFIGTQCGMTGCFPEHSAADRLVKEFTRYGINIVRMHYVSHRTPKNGYPVLDSFIEPMQLEKFDYFIAKLKENGIYVYFQLNIARKFGRVNGIENSHLLPKYKNGVDNTNERMIELQKMFHKEILEHVNPYTGIAYKDETCISMMEIANENSVIHSWFSPNHKFPDLVEPYKSEFVSKWNSFLLRKYGSTEAMKVAWLEGTGGDGSELMHDVLTEESVWDVRLSSDVSAKWGFKRPSKRDGTDRNILRLSVGSATEKKVDLSLFYKGIRLERSSYCLKFRIRTDSPMSVNVRVAQNHEPWINAGVKSTVRTDLEWKECKFNFSSPIEDDDIRLVFENFVPGTIDIADISLTAGIEYELPAHQTLETASVDWPYKHEWSVIPRRAEDFIEFLSEIEAKYFAGMYDNIKHNLGIRHPVTGTQLGYGLNQPQAGMDYCDIHCYWCHPAFPGGKWDNNHFNVRNEAIINSFGHPASTFTGVARSRLLGKPFTVSEFDIPNLNFYCAEADVMMAALGAFQNWSGLIQFSWILDTDYNRKHIWPQFDMCSAPQKLVHFPACYAMFVRGDVKKGEEDVVFAHQSSRSKDIKSVALRGASDGHGYYESQLMRSLPLAVVSGVQVEETPQLYNAEGKTLIRSEEDVPEHIRKAFEDKHVSSSTGELTWDWKETGAGYFMVDTQKTKVFSGFVRGRTFRYGGMTLAPGKSRLDWITLTLTKASGPESGQDDVLQPGNYLLAATGFVQNTDMKIVQVSDDPPKVSISQPDGGRLGTAPVLCEGIDARLSFDGVGGTMKCYALDPDGNRMQEVPVVSDENGKAVLEIGPEYKTIWYEITVAQ